MKNFRFFILTFTFFLGFYSCTSKIEKVYPPPEDLIPQNEMVDIIVDLHLMDAVLQSSQKRGDSEMESKKYYLYESILEKYDITREQFESSMEYYQQNLENIDAIYADVITKLSKLKSEAEIKN
jgi:hypothetical protein